MYDDKATTTTKTVRRRSGKAPVRVEESETVVVQGTSRSTKAHSDNLILIEIVKSFVNDKTFDNMNDSINKKLDENNKIINDMFKNCNKKVEDNNKLINEIFDRQRLEAGNGIK